jgi:hypothetical protein
VKAGALRILDLPGGDPRRRGRAHGEALRPRIAELLDRWDDALSRLYGIGRADYVERFLSRTHYVETTRRLAPAVLEEVEGIAEAAGVRARDLTAFQHVNEEFEWGPHLGHEAASDGEACSTIALMPTPDRPALIGQNLDVAEYLDGFQILLRCPTADGSGTILALSVPGMLSLNGMNSHGFAVCDNTLNQLSGDPDGLPIYAIYRQLLESRSLDEALALVERSPHSAGLNWVMGDPDGVAMIERSGREMHRFGPASAAPAYHTNHPLACADWARGTLHNASPPRPPRSSWLRMASLHHRLHDADGIALGIADLVDILSARDDPDYPVSRGGGVNADDAPIGFTLACSIFELRREAPRWHLAPGPGHCTEMRVFGFD